MNRGSKAGFVMARPLLLHWRRRSKRCPEISPAPQGQASRSRSPPQVPLWPARREGAQAPADPAIGVLRSGAFPVLRDGRTIGVVAVSGGPLGGDFTLDDKCAREALTVLEGAVG